MTKKDIDIAHRVNSRRSDSHYPRPIVCKFIRRLAKEEVITTSLNFLETCRNFLVKRFMEEMSYVFLFSLFFHCRSFSPWWPVEFLIFSPPLQSFHVVLPTKNVSSFISRSSSLSVTLFLVEFRWAVAYFLFFGSVFFFLCIPNLWT